MSMTNVGLLQQQIDDLQSRLVHQEDLLQSLNDVIATQDALINQLQLQYQQTKQRLDDMAYGSESRTMDKPPHY